MNRIGTICLLAMGLAALNVPAIEARGSPYDKIAERNLFQLHAPVTHVETVPKPPTLRKATLTGIHTILGRPVAFITVEGNKSQPAELLTLSEGQAVSGIEVKGIDEMGAVVKVLNDGELQTLTFETSKSSNMQPSAGPITSPPPALPVQVRPETMMTPEEQVALIELQRVKFKQEGNPIHKILPPTELTPGDGDASRE